LSGVSSGITNAAQPSGGKGYRIEALKIAQTKKGNQPAAFPDIQ